MQEWEYLEVNAAIDHRLWADSSGRCGKLRLTDARGFPTARHASAALVDDLGRQGWELVACAPLPTGYRLLLKRVRATGTYAKRPPLAA